ncbi:MAG TPA: hypothetical protein VH538_00150 [Gaiellaceae bacterium]
MQPSSRIATARRRARAARYAIGAVAVAGFAVFGAAARDAHPATHHTVQASDDGQADESFSFGGASLGDSGSAQPQVQSAGS